MKGIVPAAMQFRALLWLIIGILLTNVVPAHAATWEDATGPYPIAVVADTGPENGYYIYRPQTLRFNTHPIVVLCIGYNSHPEDYSALLTALASHGVVAIASTERDQSDGSKANAGLNWLIDQNEVSDSEYYQKLVASRVLAIGHSRGGNGAILASIKDRRITSLLLYAPTGVASASAVLVPTYLMVGSLDSHDSVKDIYQQVTKANAWYGELTNHGHGGFSKNAAIQYYTRAWVYTHLFDDSGTARGAFYGPNWTFKDAATWKETLKNNSAF